MEQSPLAARLAPWTPYALAALRIVAGLLFLSHGLVKMFGFPAGAQPGQQALFTLLGAAGAIEVVTGILIALGLFTRVAAFIASGQMAVAYWMFHGSAGFYPILNGGEAAILYCFLFLYFVFSGPGALSLDRARSSNRQKSAGSSSQAYLLIAPSRMYDVAGQGAAL